MGKGGRLVTTLVLFALAFVGIFFGIKALLYTPTSIVFTPTNGQVNVTMQTVGTYGLSPNPTWVSYLTCASPTAQQCATGGSQWVHTTLWQVPAHTQVNVTIYQFDSGSPLRNQQLGQVTGTCDPSSCTTQPPVSSPTGPTVGKAQLNGATFSVYNSNAGNGVGHTFSIPTIQVSVPLAGNPGTATLCAVAPCSASSTAYVHNTITFSFMSPGPGNYPWQCFVPCGLSFLYGNGGPMQTVGYMGGFMKVV